MDDKNKPLASSKKFTLVFVKNETSALLGLKKRGFGTGKWNGFGGKVEQGEDVSNCAIRELKEESNLEVAEDHLKYLGCTVYRHLQKRTVDVVYIFIAKVTSGVPKESEEMRPKWFEFGEIPYDEMWPDSEYWMPSVLGEKYFSAEFLYEEGGLLAEKDVKELTDAPTY